MKELIALYGPWLLGLTTVVATLLVANKKAWTQLVNIVNQWLWIVWSVATGSWGFLPLTAVMCFVFLRNYQKWSSDEKQRRATCAEHVGMGWVVGNASRSLYRAWEDGPVWTPTLKQALHFSRRQDAEEFSADDEDAWCIVRVPYQVTLTELEYRRGYSNLITYELSRSRPRGRAS